MIEPRLHREVNGRDFIGASNRPEWSFDAGLDVFLPKSRHGVRDALGMTHRSGASHICTGVALLIFWHSRSAMSGAPTSTPSSDFGGPPKLFADNEAMPSAVQPQQVSRNHHYVSAGYLAQFTDKGTRKGLLCVLDFSVRNFFRSKPKYVACNTDYNAIEVPGLPLDAYESAQGRFEGQAIREVRKICETGQLPDMRTFAYVYNLITLFAVKNPAIRNATASMQDTIYRQLMKIWTSSPAIYEQRLEDAKEAGFIQPGRHVSFETMKDFVQRDAYTIKIHSHSHVVTELSAFDGLLPAVAERYWSVMSVKRGAPDLITCDRPAPTRLDAATIVFTISPRRALLGATELYAPAEFEIGAHHVAQINTDLLEQANSQIYSRTDQIALLKGGQIGIYDMRRTFPTGPHS